MVAVADDREPDRGTGREPSLRLVPGEQVTEPRAVSASDSPARPEVHTRTFLIADVRGYTKFTAARGDEAAGVLAARFAAVTRAVVTEHAGQLLELRGDEALVVFTSARTAIRAALALRERFVAETLADSDLPLPVGMGLDVGEAVEVEGGYRGGALNLAARLCSAAAPGEVLASREVTHLARHVDGVRYLDRGRLRFKGLTDLVPVVRVLPDIKDAEREAAFLAAVATPRTRRRPSWKLLVGAALVLVLLVAAGTYAFLRATGPAPVLSAANHVDVIDLANGDVVEQVPLDQQPAAVAAGVGSLWVTNPAAGTVSRLDPDSRSVDATIEVGGQPSGVVVAGGSVWVSDQDARRVVQISPDVNKVVATVEVGNRPTGIAAGESGVWVANSTDGTVTQIDPRTGTPSDPVDVGAGPSGIAVTDDTVWVTNTDEGTVSAIDSGTFKLRATYPVGSGPTGIAELGAALWVANSLDGTLARLDPATGAVGVKIPVGNGPTGVAVAGGAVWVSNEYGATLVRVNPKTNGIDLRLRVGGTPHGLAAAGGSLWVTAAATGTSHRGGTLTVLAPVDESIDPAVSYADTVLRMTNDGLLAVRQAPGAAGTTVVPDLATAIPTTPVDGGKTYSFRLRKGIRYSTGALVQASDFRRAIQRQFRLPDASGYLYAGIRGADACEKTPTSCDLSSGIETDDTTGSVTFHLVAPDPEFLYKLTLPYAVAVPPGTPDVDTGSSPVPATGPYMIASHVPEKSTELVRNPRFREWSRAAQPDGYPNRIVIRATRGPGDLDRVLQGKADLVTLSTFVSQARFGGRLQELKTRYAAQLHRNVGRQIFFMAFNTTVPPFDDVRARRALNYAVDARLLLDAVGGDDIAQSTCQVLPPAFPGYAPHCPYSQDMDKARKLVAASGSAGDKVIVVVPKPRPEAGPYLKSVLDDLGYKTTLKVLPIEGYHGVDHQAQLTMNFWYPYYPAASNYLTELFSCRYADPTQVTANVGRFCQPAVEAKIEKAEALQRTQPAAASRIWQQVDRDVVDQAALLPLWLFNDISVTSRRIGNFVYQPGSGVLLSQLWVRPGTQ